MDCGTRLTARRWAVAAALLVPAAIVLGGRAIGQARPAGEQPATRPAARPLADGRLARGLIGSKHDFTRPGDRPRDLCIACHPAHILSARGVALRRRPPATQPLRSYQSVGLALNRASLLCLSCHDGVIAPDVYRVSHATHLADQVGASRRGARPLGGHPVGVRFPTMDPRFSPIGAVRSQSGLKLPDGRIQCTTCHDPHNRAGQPKMLVISNDRSRLCLSCHRL